MPLSAAEKQKRYRERVNADPHRRELHLNRERDRWKRRVESGKVKQIQQVSDREKRKRRKAWRQAQNRYAAAQRRRKEMETALLSPPTSPPTPAQVEEQHREEVPPGSSAQKRRGRKLIRKDRSKAYQTINKLNMEIKELERQIQKEMAERAC